VEAELDIMMALLQGVQDRMVTIQFLVLSLQLEVVAQVHTEML
jgi:hypothetical protein